MQNRTWMNFAVSAAWLLVQSATVAGVEPTSQEVRRQKMESDWLIDERIRAAEKRVTNVTSREDAAGGCDGVKDGKYGFHTGNAQDPWWQVDLGETQAIVRVLVWNRCDSVERAAKLNVQLSGDGQSWETVYRHDGSAFFGVKDGRPLEVRLSEKSARYVRVLLPGNGFLHLDEVEVVGAADPEKNLALGRPADQVSISQWSVDHLPPAEPDWSKRTPEVLAYCERLAREANESRESAKAIQGLFEPSASGASLETVIADLRTKLAARNPEQSARPLFLEARALQRRIVLANPILDFDTILFTKRVPGSFNHMSDQYYGWWSKPGGGIYQLRNFTRDEPSVECLTESFREPGSFLRPTLSYDGQRILFAWCRHYPGLAKEKDKLNKANVPEDAFYHLYEMNRDGSEVRRLTRGKYDDFDGRYLPDGRVVFLSTRRGQALQVGRATAQQTLVRDDAPDCYVRCGGDAERPVAVYTLHTMNADGSGLCAISPFEMFEWTPEISHDGSILYSRWDYIDRDNMPYMGLWAMSPDGVNARIVYGNFTRSPHCTFEPKPIPGSSKIIFTASAHHAQTMGSLVLLDPSAGLEGAGPITRLTPEVPFPEIEGWPKTYYANPWPLSERHYLVAWGHEGMTVPGPTGWDRWHAVQRPKNGMALYFFDASGAKELLYFDPEIACADPIPLRSRPRPPVLASAVAWNGPPEGAFLLGDVYRGLTSVKRGEIKALRLVAVPPKTHPEMNFPNLGLTRDDPGKCVLGTVPVEEDGSAYFRAPAGVILFFQALDARGLAVQTMRSTTHVQPGQTLSCIGCHEDRAQAPQQKYALAARREPSKIAVGPEGSWPLRFDRLVQPVLDRHCVSCHSSKSSEVQAAKFDLTPAQAYDSLVKFGQPSLFDQVWEGYRRGSSIERNGLTMGSALFALLNAADGHYGVLLDAESRERWATWIDTYAQKAGAFSAAQEQELEGLRRICSPLLIERMPRQTAARSSL